MEPISRRRVVSRPTDGFSPIRTQTGSRSRKGSRASRLAPGRRETWERLAEREPGLSVAPTLGDRTGPGYAAPEAGLRARARPPSVARVHRNQQLLRPEAGCELPRPSRRAASLRRAGEGWGRFLVCQAGYPDFDSGSEKSTQAPRKLFPPLVPGCGVCQRYTGARGAMDGRKLVGYSFQSWNRFPLLLSSLSSPSSFPALFPFKCQTEHMGGLKVQRVCILYAYQFMCGLALTYAHAGMLH